MAGQSPRFESEPPRLPDWAHWEPFPIGDPVPPWLLHEIDPAIRVELARIVLDHQTAVLKSKLDTTQRVREALDKAQ
ncbi:MAG TPA: hypothetical protein VFJ65_03565 [Solirubrobacterales bacterium]|nr:hypothetical protein [Solirubrobacterales bacterium]